MQAQLERGLLLPEGIGYQPRDEIDEEVKLTAVARVLNLRNILELINQRLAD